MQRSPFASKKKNSMHDFKSMTTDELAALISDLGEAPYRTPQITRWIYLHGASSIDEMTNLSKKFKEKLRQSLYISALKPLKEDTSKNGVRKYLFELEDGNLIESVLIPDADRLTLCISTQAGCALGCKFCLTGRGGFIRNLETSEIINQICSVKNLQLGKKKISNLVLMGMGEPLANYDNTLQALNIITDTNSLQFSPRKVTLSTAGLVPEIKRLGKDAQVNLAVSLNATDDDTRDYLMPINKKYPLKELLKVCREFPLPSRKRITFEYVLIKGINDSLEDAKRLTQLLKGIRCKINLISFNEYPSCKFTTPDTDRIHSFQQILIDSNYTSTFRASKGLDILAACGQLGSHRSNS